MDIRQSQNYAKYIAKTGWDVEKKNNIYYFTKRFPIIGSFLKIQRPNKINLLDIHNIQKKHRVFHTLIEPVSSQQVALLQSSGFKPASPYLPSKTLLLNLSGSKNTLFNQLKKDARYSLKKSLHLKVQETKNLKLFHQLWKSSTNFKRHKLSLSHLIFLKKSFGKNSLFLITSNNSAGAIFLKANSTAYYWQAFTSKSGRQQHTQYKIVWEGILWAKKNGCKVFDFEGIYDDRYPNKAWLGFTHFKKSFGGKELMHPGALSQFRLPL